MRLNCASSFVLAQQEVLLRSLSRCVLSRKEDGCLSVCKLKDASVWHLYELRFVLLAFEDYNSFLYVCQKREVVGKDSELSLCSWCGNALYLSFVERFLQGKDVGRDHTIYAT